MASQFAVDMMPVWANRHTLSIEPYLTRRLQPGEVHEWSLEYEFVGL